MTVPTILRTTQFLFFCFALNPVRAGDPDTAATWRREVDVASLKMLAAANPPDLDIVSRYLDARRIQQVAMRGAQIEVEIDGRLPKLEKQGRLRALRTTSSRGQIAYQVLSASGDRLVMREVISRYLSAETGVHDQSAVAITPANYKFRLRSVIETGNRRVYRFRITPKKKKLGLFKGELWLDGQTGMPVLESGQFVKNPSVFLKRIQFVREYEIRGGVAIPRHIASVVETRMAGRAELTVEFGNFAPLECVSDSATADQVPPARFRPSFVAAQPVLILRRGFR